MNEFSNAEMADMHYVYGAAAGNGRAAARMYLERFPNRRQPSHVLFGQLHRRLRESGSFVVRSHIGRERATRTPVVEETVLQEFAINPQTSLREAERVLGVGRTSIMRILHDDNQHPYHFQTVQALCADDYPKRIEFSRWYLQQRLAQPDFPSWILFSDESSFTQDGIVNLHNMHVWAHDNPRCTRAHAHQKRFTVNVWAGILGDTLLGPYLLPKRLHGDTYRIFLERVLPDLMVGVPAATRRNIWFQHDGAPAHFQNSVRQYLDRTYPNRWIGRGGPVQWPPRSPDLTPLDFYLWGHMKALVYETPVTSDMDLIGRIAEAAARVRDTPGQFERVRESMRRRCETCILANGRNFEHLL